MGKKEVKAVFKGLLSGILVGVVVSVGAAAGLSMLIGGPTTKTKPPQMAGLELPAGSEFNKPREDKKAILPESEPVASGPVTPKVKAPEPDTVAPLKADVTEPAAQPVAAPEPGAMEQPKLAKDPVATLSTGATGAEKAPPAVVTATAPKAPEVEPKLSISTEPAQPAPPKLEEPKTAFETAKPAGTKAPAGTPPAAEVAAPKAKPAGNAVVIAPKTDQAPVLPEKAPVFQSVSPAGLTAPSPGTETALLAEGKTGLDKTGKAAGAIPQGTAQKLIAPVPASKGLTVQVDPAPATKSEPKVIAEKTPDPLEAPKDAPQATEKKDNNAAEVTVEPVEKPEPKPASQPEQKLELAEPAPKPEPAQTPAPAAKPQPDDSQSRQVAKLETAQPEKRAKPAVVPQIQVEPRPVAPSQTQAEAASPPPAIRIGKPAGSFKTIGARLGNSSVRPAKNSSGLPTIVSQTETQKNDGTAAGVTPLERYASDFNALGNKAKMAIVLIDVAGEKVELEKLSAFPYPLAVAVDTARSDAKERMAKFRAAGFEVLAMVAMEQGATPRDVEVSLPVLLDKVPEAVGVMEAPGGGIQFDRKVSDQVTQILGASGHGLLLFSKGLNTAQKLASKNGVPSAVIFRDIDAQGQNARTIRRFLNAGALKADSEGGVVMVGRMMPETVNALLVWGLDGRGSQVSLAPVSQLLKRP